MSWIQPMNHQFALQDAWSRRTTGVRKSWLTAEGRKPAALRTWAPEPLLLLLSAQGWEERPALRSPHLRVPQALGMPLDGSIFPYSSAERPRLPLRKKLLKKKQKGSWKRETRVGGCRFEEQHVFTLQRNLCQSLWYCCSSFNSLQIDWN